MKTGVEPGKRKAIFIAVLSSLAIIIGLALMIVAVQDNRMQMHVSSRDNAAFSGSAAGRTLETDSGSVKAGSEAGYEETAGEEAPFSISDKETAARQPESSDLASDPGVTGDITQQIETGGIKLNISYDLSPDIAAALEENGGSAEGGQAEKSKLDQAKNGANKEITEAEKEREEQLEAARENLESILYLFEQASVLNIPSNLSDLTTAIEAGDSSAEGGQAEKGELDQARNDANKEMAEAEEEKAEDQLEAARENLKNILDLLKQAAELHTSNFNAILFAL
jgi:Asp-tRNA(Asn)/Glu-tRNA(Gln) amidotransferase C subunit